MLFGMEIPWSRWNQRSQSDMHPDWKPIADAPRDKPFFGARLYSGTLTMFRCRWSDKDKFWRRLDNGEREHPTHWRSDESRQA